jgi:hypothetical protein
MSLDLESSFNHLVKIITNKVKKVNKDNFNLNENENENLNQNQNENGDINKIHNPKINYILAKFIKFVGK